ncbi:MAG: helix-turn-helix domain-containing protein [Phycisphaerae bacterium]|nr:helix-turn-helix domain-containing protein [Phycisphaerae bacterium]
MKTRIVKAGKMQKPAERDSYMALIQRLPLRPIRTDAEHERAIEIIGELIGHNLDNGESDYLDTLIVLTNKYEDEKHTPCGSDLTPQEALRAIMKANRLSQAQIGKIIGSESAVSMFLNGERALSKAHIKAIASRFRVDATLFL